MSILNWFKHPAERRSKTYLPNPGLEYRIIFKKGAVETIMRAKGWRTKSEMAAALGITRAYLSMLQMTRVQATSTIITRVAVLMGNTGENWWIYYDIVPWGVTDHNHPTWNKEKELGQVPYSRFSTAVEIRGLDYHAEKMGPMNYAENPIKKRKSGNFRKILDKIH